MNDENTFFLTESTLGKSPAQHKKKKLEKWAAQTYNSLTNFFPSWKMSWKTLSQP